MEIIYWAILILAFFFFIYVVSRLFKNLDITNYTTQGEQLHDINKNLEDINKRLSDKE